jgi:SAM-dependent methyltransferase
MRFLNPSVAKDLQQGKPLRIDIGSGQKPREGFYGLDQLDGAGVDIVADLNRPLDLLPDNCAEYVFSSHSMEHVDQMLPLMGEIHRIMRPGALLHVIAPHFTNPYYYSDPTHVRFFGLYTMSYFVDEEKQPGARRVPAFPGAARFEMESVSLSFYRTGLVDRLVVPFFRFFANRTPRAQDFYERRLSWLYPAAEVRYRMRACKASA